MLRLLVDSLHREAAEADSGAQDQTPEKPKLVMENHIENTTEDFENKLDRGLTCLVLAGLEGNLAPDMQKHAEAFAVAVRPPIDSPSLNKDAKAKVKKQRLCIRESFKNMLSRGIPKVCDTDAHSLTECRTFYTHIQNLLTSDAKAQDLVTRAYLGGFCTDAAVSPQRQQSSIEAEPLVDVKPVLENLTNLKTKPKQKNKQMLVEEEDLDSLLAEFGVAVKGETKKAKNMKRAKQ